MIIKKSANDSAWSEGGWLYVIGEPHLSACLYPLPLRVSDDCIDHVYHSVMSQLNEEHAEVRLSAFQIASELFSRSHHFRTLLVDNFQVRPRQTSREAR